MQNWRAKLGVGIAMAMSVFCTFGIADYERGSILGSVWLAAALVIACLSRGRPTPPI